MQRNPQLRFGSKRGVSGAGSLIRVVSPMHAMGSTEQFRVFLADELIGIVDEVHTDMPSVIGRFHPTEAFARFRHIFDHEHAAIESRDTDTWPKARDAIFSLGLRLEDVRTGEVHSGTSGAVVPGELGWLHIHGSKIWWRPT